MSWCLRLLVWLIVSSVGFSPEAGFAAKCENKFYIISLKDSYANKKYKVRAFTLYPGNAVYGIPKIPIGWLYGFYDEHGERLTATAETDNEAVDIGYFKEFLVFIILKDERDERPYLRMTLVCNKPDGTAKIIQLKTNDFKIKNIHKCMKKY